MKKFRYILLILILGCTNNRYIECPLGKEISYPIDSLIQYNNYEYEKLGVYKTIIFLDASCPSCMEEIYVLDTYLKEGTNENNQFIVVLSGPDSEFTQAHINEINNFEFPILFDPQDKFYKANDLGIIKLKQSNCLLIDSNNTIRDCGSPHLDKKTERRQKRIITKHS